MTTGKAQIELLIYDCLRLDPKERFNMAEVERAVKEIKNEEE